MRPRKLAYIPFSCLSSSSLTVLDRSPLSVSRTIRCLPFVKGGIGGTGDKAGTRAETFDNYSQDPFVLLPMTHQGHVGPQKLLQSNHRKGLLPSYRALLPPNAIAASTAYWIWMPQSISGK